MAGGGRGRQMKAYDSDTLLRGKGKRRHRGSEVSSKVSLDAGGR